LVPEGRRCVKHKYVFQINGTSIIRECLVAC
jgi:hypothetical protein